MNERCRRLRGAWGAACGQWLALGAAACIGAGCAQSRVTDPPRTATEQFLLSKAATEAVDQLSFETLRGRRVWVDTQFFAGSDEAFVLGEFRARMLLSGVQLVPVREGAQIVAEVRSGGVGVDRHESLLGIPAITLGSDGAGVGTPELSIVKNRDQRGVASVSYVAYWVETGEVVASSGPYIGRSYRDDWWFVGFGPRTVGDIPPAEKED